MLVSSVYLDELLGAFSMQRYARPSLCQVWAEDVTFQKSLMVGDVMNGAVLWYSKAFL